MSSMTRENFRNALGNLVKISGLESMAIIGELEQMKVALTVDITASHLAEIGCIQNYPHPQPNDD